MASLLKCLIPTIGSPARLGDREGRHVLADFYGALADLSVVYEDWLLIAAPGPQKFFLAFDRDGWSDSRPPRWPDPDHPQQQHLDLAVPDLDASTELALGMGGTLLRDADGSRVIADPVGHPFCLEPDPAAAGPAVRRLVSDCLSPRALAGFYEGFLQNARRVVDTPQRVVLDLDDEQLPQLAFQHAQFRAARWPDPDHPAQLHVDFRWHDSLTARYALDRAEQLGAVRPTADDRGGVLVDPAGHPFCIQNETPEGYAIVGLYLHPPQYAVAYVTGLPSTPDPGPGAEQVALAGRLAALQPPDPAPDRVGPLLEFLTEAAAAVPAGAELNVICDWDDSYDQPAVQQWLAGRDGLVVHRNPPGFRWWERAEDWVSRIPEPGLVSAIGAWADRWRTEPRPFSALS